jgi:pilus assembly protein Flp/PilA
VWTAATPVDEGNFMITRIIRVERRLCDAGASAVEYGLMVAAIAAVIVGIVFGLGGIVKATFSQTEECIVVLQNGPKCTP